MKNIGFNENELRKTIVTKIDKDGFHERTIIYGKDSGESEDTVDAEMTTRYGHGVFATIGYPGNTASVIVGLAETDDNEDPVYKFDIGEEYTDSPTYTEEIHSLTDHEQVISIVPVSMENADSAYWCVYAVDSNYIVLDRCQIYINVEEPN